MARPARHRADPPSKPDVTVFSHPAPRSSGCCHQHLAPHSIHRLRFSNRGNGDEQVASCLDDAFLHDLLEARGLFLAGHHFSGTVHTEGISLFGVEACLRCGRVLLGAVPS